MKNYETAKNFCEGVNTKIIKRIENYIEKNDYTWTIEKLLKEYNKKKNGFYISFTANECINDFKKEFELLNKMEVKK